jgi:hypothetical protein
MNVKAKEVYKTKYAFRKQAYSIGLYLYVSVLEFTGTKQGRSDTVGCVS